MGLTEAEGEGCILADEMGLGKTLSAIALVYTMLSAVFQLSRLVDDVDIGRTVAFQEGYPMVRVSAVLSRFTEACLSVASTKS